MSVVRPTLQFYRDIDEELTAADTLVVLARGLGMASVLARFVVPRVRPGRLIIALNVSQEVARSVVWPAIQNLTLASPSDNPALLLPRFINADYSIDDRVRVYAAGGFIAASSTVLVHDLLCRKLPSESVDGVIVFAADRVAANSNTHFVLTLFRQQNRSGFIKALSENAPALTAGFHVAEKVMRRLFVSRMANWPRFHSTVKKCLSARTVDLLDLSVKLSPLQAVVISALRNLASVILADLRSAAPTLDVSDLFRVVQTSDGGSRKILAGNFHEAVRRQLEESPGSRRIAGGEKIRSLVADLKVMRDLLEDAVDLNAVRFYQRVLTLRTTQQERGQNNWLMRREAQGMLRVALNRIYKRRPADSLAVTAGSLRGLGRQAKRVRQEKGNGKEKAQEEMVNIPVLDPNLKWSGLKSAMGEIESDVGQAKALEPGSDVGRVLIVVRGEALADEIRHLFCGGGKAYMKRLFEAVLPTTARDAAWELYDDREDGDEGGEEAGGGRQRTMPEMLGSDVQRRPNSALATSAAHASSGASGAWPSTAKRRRGSSRSDAGVTLAHAENAPNWPWPVRAGEFAAIPSMSDDKEKLLGGIKSFFGLATAEMPAKDVEVLLWSIDWTDSQGGMKALLDQYKPSFIIMYNADVAVVRQVEIFKAESPGRAVRLYLMVYEDPIDEDRYVNVMTREKRAFKSLIRERATMLLHADQEGRGGVEHVLGGPDSLPVDGVVGRALGTDRDSRVGRQAEARSTQQVIIVDTRELRSALPMALFREGIMISAVTLEVADFVLSKEIGVERKSVEDLIGSFKTGRLFNQAEALCRHYKNPCLLIELYDTTGKMSLSAAVPGGIPSEIVPSHIISKLVLLIQQFPKLRLLWAQGSQGAANLFLDLKKQSGEPDPVAASAAGFDSAETGATEFNSSPEVLLRNLPGIDGNNIKVVMRKVKNVSALLNMPLAAMTKVLGSAGKARRLHEFANQKPEEALASL